MAKKKEKCELELEVEALIKTPTPEVKEPDSTLRWIMEGIRVSRKDGYTDAEILYGIEHYIKGLSL